MSNVKHFAFVLVALLTLALASCSKTQSLTESELRFKKALTDQSLLIQQADNVLDTKLTGNLLNDLNHITYASELAIHAEQVFKEAKIVGIESEALRALKARFSTYEKSAGEEAVALFFQSIDRTIAFKKSVDEIPIPPLLSEVSSTSNNMIRFLGEQYNEDLKKCCLTDLRNISIFLGQTNVKEHYELRKEIANIEINLERLLNDPKKAVEYKKRISSFKLQYSKNM